MNFSFRVKVSHRVAIMSGVLAVTSAFAFGKDWGTFPQWQTPAISYAADSETGFVAAGNAPRKLGWQNISNITAYDTYSVNFVGTPSVWKFQTTQQCSWFQSIACVQVTPDGS
jgi:hypothetical protein